MANKYANLIGTNKIKDEYTKINIGFDGVETDINALNDRVDALDSRVDTIITTPIDGEAAAQEIVDARASAVKSKTFATLDARFEETEQDIATHMAEFVSVKNPPPPLNRAYGDGVTNDTTAIQNILNNCSFIYFPKGTYMVDSVTISSKTHIILERDAVIKLRTAPSVPDGGVFGVVKFTSGAAGSIIEGGCIDGNRDSLKTSFTQGRWWINLRVENCDNITIRDVKLVNSVTFGCYIAGGNNVEVENLYIEKCSQGFAIDGVNRSSVKNIRCNDIYNDNLPVWQHAFELRNINETIVDGLYLKNFHPDSAALDSGSYALVITRVFNNCHIKNVILDSYYGTKGDGAGIEITGGKDLTLSDVSILDFDVGINVSGIESSKIENFYIDGYYRGISGKLGIKIEGAGCFSGAGGDGGDLRANAPTKNLIISNGIVKRYSTGVLTFASSDLQLKNILSIGNTQYGLELYKSRTNNVLFPGAPYMSPYNVTIDSCYFIANGYSGIYIDDCENITFDKCVIANNGQNTGAPDRDGIIFSAITTGNTARNVDILKSNKIYDDQDWIKTNGASFVPGSTDSNNKKVLTFIDTTKLYVGQYIQINNATGSSNINAKIVEIDQDEVTVQTSGPITFSETGNLVAVTGTITTQGVTLNGVGTSFITQFPGRTIVKIGSEYRKVVRVDSDTKAILDTALPTDITTPTTINKVCVTVQGIQSQRYGVTVSDNADGLYFDAIKFPKHAQGQFFNIAYAQYANFKGGSRLCLQAYNISTVGTTSPALIGSIPQGYRVVSVKFTVNTAISGGGATNVDLKMYVGGSVFETYATGLPLTAGVNFNSSVYGNPLTGIGTLYMFVNGGIPTQGVVSAEILIEKCGI